MHPDPNTASIVVFFVLSVGGLVVDAGQQRLFSPTDEPVSVVSVKSQVPAGSSAIMSCLSSASPRPSFRVRFQKLKLKSATFTRTLLDRVMISTYASERNSVDGTNIVNCVNVADAGGFDGFSFDGVSCDMFKIEFQSCGCETGAQDVFYVQATFWDKKDSALPRIVYSGSVAIAVFHLASSVYDKIHLFVGRPMYLGLGNATSLDEKSRLGCSTSAHFDCTCTGSECFATNFVDIQHCVRKSCDSPGNTTMLQAFSISSIPMNTFVNIFYMLLECGKTILLGDSPVTGSSRGIRVMSHQGYGCQWYPKTGVDHECVVTFSTGNRTSSYSISGSGPVLDGNTTTCEGDSLSVLNGTSTNSSLLIRWDACALSSSNPTVTAVTTTVTIVFKRTAKQHQTDGFNWGFNVVSGWTLQP